MSAAAASSAPPSYLQKKMKEKEEMSTNTATPQKSKYRVEGENSNGPNKQKQENKTTHEPEVLKENPSHLQNLFVLDAETHVNGGGESETHLKNQLANSPQQKTKVAAMASKQSQKGKHTVPQPFSLATEKRMCRERRGGAPESATSSNPKVERTSAERSAASRAALRSSERAEKRAEYGQKTSDKVEITDTEAKRPPLAEKAGRSIEREAETKSMRKSSTFKATPLPSFYHKKAPPSLPELKKVPSTKPKSPLLHRRSRSISEPLNREELINKSKATTKHKVKTELGNGKTEQINRSMSVSENGSAKPESFNRSKSISESRIPKPEPINSSSSSKGPNGVTATSQSKNAKIAINGKSSAKSISSTAKEAINKLLRGSWKAPKIAQKKKSLPKSRKSCGNSGLEKGVAAANGVKGVFVI